jgi:Fic family protein
VRGKDKMPGRFRTFQNFIAKPGSRIEDARYVPPAPEILQEALDNFEKYIHYDEKDRLVQLAVIHVQFEIIHPFGNGRIGRILIPLFLYEKKILNSPMFYISAYFEGKRDEYYRRLRGISEKGDWQNWILFFLKALIEQGEKNTGQAREILKTYERMKSEFPKIIRSQYSLQAIDFLFSFPIFNCKIFRQSSAIPKASANRIIAKLLESKIITQLESARGRTAAFYMFDKLFRIIES